MPFWRRKDPSAELRSEWLDRVWPSPGAASMKPRYPIGKVPTGGRRQGPSKSGGDSAEPIAATPGSSYASHHPKSRERGQRGAKVVDLGRAPRPANPPKEASKGGGRSKGGRGPIRPVGRFTADRSTLRSRLGVGLRADGASISEIHGGPQGGAALQGSKQGLFNGSLDWEALRPYLTGLAFAFGVLAVLLSAAGFAGAAFRGVDSLLNGVPPEAEAGALALIDDSPREDPEADKLAAPPAAQSEPRAASPKLASAPDISKEAPLVAAPPKEAVASADPVGETPFYFQVSFPDLGLASESAVVVDASTGETLYAWNASRSQPIAGLTKLIAAMVYLDTRPNLGEIVTIKTSDLGDHPKAARMYPGWRFSAQDLLTSIVVGSENPAVEALIRTSGVGRDEFMIRMAEKAQLLGLKEAFFYDPTGLDTENAASAEDLARVIGAVGAYPRVAQLSRLREASIKAYGRDTVFKYRNANPLIREEGFQVRSGKAGFTNDAGYCLASQVSVGEFKDLFLVFLGAPGRLEAMADIERTLKYIQKEQAKRESL